MENWAKIIAVDFDGTLVEEKWPQIGAVNVKVLNYCKSEQAKGARIILWTNRVGETLENAVKWCEEHELKLDAINDNLPEAVKRFGFNTRKIYADEFIDDRAVQNFSLPYSKDLEWAEREVELACASEREDVEKPDDADYGVGRYKAALRAYRSLIVDGHTGFDIQFAKSILNRLADGKCLTPINDTPDIWEDMSEVCLKTAPAKHYQCTRMGSLFKTLAPDGTVTYSDVNRVQVVDVDRPNVAYTSGFATRLIDKVFPIAMPYLPDSKKFKVVREMFLTDPKNGDFDTVAYLYIVTPDGKKVELNGYFKDSKEGMVRIDKAEYDERKARRVGKK